MKMLVVPQSQSKQQFITASLPAAAAAAHLGLVCLYLLDGRTCLLRYGYQHNNWSEQSIAPADPI